MSRYKAYPAYRDSGVEWLGEIPRDWKTSPLKFLARIKNGQDYKDVETEDGYPVIGSGGQFSYASTYSYDKESVLLGRKGTIDKPLYVNEPFWTVDTMYYTEINRGIPPKFLYYLALTIQFSRYSTNTALPSMTQENLGNYVFAIPEREQDKLKIAAFLDHKTAKIDALIEKQQRLIELLKEKRQALISHAVTKGLNPNAPMKDSGVEWVDAVPAHWRISKLSYHARISNGATPSRDNMLFWENGTVGWLNSSKVNDDVIEEADQFITEFALSKTSVKPVTKGDLVMAITGEGQTRGRVAICNITATINQHLASISICDKLLNHEFLYLWLEGNYERIRYESEGAGSTKGAITCSEIGAFPAILPPLEEQEQIICYVTERKKKFDGLVRRAISAIELMQERRTALISAAVTGKIDVRDWQPATAQEEAGGEC
jgi:type I restriction enzyme, S subunit